MRAAYIAAGIGGLVLAGVGVAVFLRSREPNPGANIADVPANQHGEAPLKSAFGVSMFGNIRNVLPTIAGNPGSSYNMNAAANPIGSAPASLTDNTRGAVTLATVHPVTTAAVKAASTISPTRNNFPT